MGIVVNHASFDQCRQALGEFMADLGPDVREAGEAARDAVVQSTLDGQADADGPFKPYSAYYQAQLDKLGGKPGGNVDLRGIVPAGKAGAGTRRPARGILDPDSEMSTDLIPVEEAGPASVKLSYRPRNKQYMVKHQDTRPWFSLNKTSVVSAVFDVLTKILTRRADKFNKKGP